MMNRDRAIDLISRYFKAWVDMDFDLFAGTVHDDATVRENTGAVMEGREQLHRWFAWWTRSNNEVDYWNIHRIFYDEEQQTAFVDGRSSADTKVRSMNGTAPARSRSETP